MTAEKDLEKLLTTLSPVLLDGEYVFLTLASSRYGDHAELAPIASVLENEGLTLVVPRANADKGQLGYEAVFRCITLQVHSSLEAVGLTAAFSAKLTEHGISANVLAGYFHDHVFVQSEFAGRAMDVLGEFGKA